MIIEAVVCMAIDFNRCKDIRIPVELEHENGKTLHQCMLVGQTELAKWLEGNPNWTIKRWKCIDNIESQKI